MGWAEYVLVPVVTLALFAAAVASWRRRRHRTRLYVVLGALGLEAWLWLAALEPPVGPHLPLLYALVLVNLPIVGGLIYQGTGFSMNPRWLPPGDSAARTPRGEYDGYRGD